MFDGESKFERWCWWEPPEVPSSRGERSLEPRELRTWPGIIDDRADESRRQLLREKSDWALGEGEAESEISSMEEASDWPEFRIIDKRNGLRARGPEDDGR